MRRGEEVPSVMLVPRRQPFGHVAREDRDVERLLALRNRRQPQSRRALETQVLVRVDREIDGAVEQARRRSRR